MDNYAPILITVYDRFNHLKRAVESLRKCPEAKNTEIFIASDMTSEKEKEIQISDIRNYINSINGFKKVTPIFFDENVGIEHSWNFSLDLVFQKFDKIIFLEDDIEVSPLFLKYINTGLNFYESDPNVLTISGFSPFKIESKNELYSKEVFFSNSFNAWGFGTWRSKFIGFLKYRQTDVVFGDLKKCLNNKSTLEKVKTLSIEYQPHFKYCLKYNKLPAFDHHFSFYSLINGYAHVYPTINFVNNTGHDGSGLRALKSKKHQSLSLRKFILDEIRFKPFNGILENQLMNKYSNNLVVYIKLISIELGVFDMIKTCRRKVYNYLK